MADHYVKLWASIVDSSVWKEPDRHRIVWVTMLTMADKHGFVGASIDGLARRANVPEADVESALQAFLSPDPRSRNREHEGRRIQEVPRGWHILNHGYFRDLQDKEELRLYERERKREQRDRVQLSRTVRDTDGTDRDSLDKPAFVPGASSDASAVPSQPVPSTILPSFHPFARGTVQEAAEPEMEGRKEAVDSLIGRLGRSKRP